MSVQRLTELMERMCEAQGISKTGRQFTSEYLSVVVPIGASSTSVTVKTIATGKKQYITFIGGSTM
jgi:hypothetical protein